MATLRPAGTRLVREQDGRVEQRAEAGGGDDAGLLEQGLPGDQRGGHRRGVRGRGALAGRGPARVHREHRHVRADPAGGAGELPGVAERFQVHDRELGAARPAPTTSAGRCRTRPSCRPPRRTRRYRCRAGRSAQAGRCRPRRTAPPDPRCRGRGGARQTWRPGPGSAPPRRSSSGRPGASRTARQVSSRWMSPETPRPEVITTRDRTPRFPHSLATLDTWAGGTATTTRSGTVGRSATDGTARHALDLLRVRVHREQRALVTGVADVEQDRPADGPSRGWRRPLRPTAGPAGGARLATSARCSRPATASR